MPRTLKLKEKFRLEDHLLLSRFIGSKIGVKEVKDIRDFKEVPEGTDTNGHSYMYSRILSRRGRLIEGAKLQKYDQNIIHYAEKISKKMPDPINFKYYQYLALLYNEIYLDRLFQPSNRPVFLNDINEWAVENGVKTTFSRKELEKLAYWMATGSGKTFIMHANYWQFLKYNKGPNRIDYNNIILITANDGMSKQHLCDLEKSGIPAALYGGETAGYFEESRDKIKVISIHKLKLPEDKRGKVESIDISRLTTKNLVFVDEGHKGQKSEDRVWKRVRELLAKDGFTFEYSATFGQVITSKESDYYNEYTKSIIFDYSYKYFNIDGYGKDFRVLNLDPKQFDEAQTRTLLLANALAFYEQLVLYSQLGSNIQEYNIEKPLWIFVGSKVRGENSDIVEVVKFLHWFLSEEVEVKRIIRDVLAGKSGIISDGKDAFTPTYPDRNFSYLRETGITPDQAYEGILNEVFHLQPGQGRTLQFINLKKAEGEIALTVGIVPRFFAVINVGDKPGLLKLIGERLPHLPHLNNELSPSQFENINRPESSINILIGAKKFIEGWNSWRVSNMCLLNVGKSEGPQIIQLFGRGVRLKGRGLSLKRSRFLEPPNPPLIQVLETLHIYGVRAKYMETFKRTLDIEDALGYELTLPTDIIDPFPDDLQTLVVDENWNFENTLLRLNMDEHVKIKLNLLPRVEILDSRDEALTAEVQTPPRFISPEILNLLDWDRIHHALLEYKVQRDPPYYNIVIEKEVLKNIMYKERYTLTCTEDLIAPLDFKSLQTIVEKITIQILKGYLNRYYSARRVEEERHHCQLKPLLVKNDNILKSYMVKVTEDNKPLANYLQKIIDDKTIYDSRESKSPPDMRFISAPFTFRNALYEGHLYQPLLIRQENKSIVTIPTGLNEGEKKFVEELNKYVTSKKPSENIYLLRNRTRGKGIGFYKHHSFYPDFVLWMKKDPKQVIVFIDPKGIARLDIDEDLKFNLHNHLKNEVKLDNSNVKLDAFIVSVTSHEYAQHYLKRRINIKEYEEKHLLFQEIKEGVTNPTYMETLFRMIRS